MPPPVVFPCGGPSQPSCPPTNSSSINGPYTYTLDDMKAHGDACYRKGLEDAKAGDEALKRFIDSKGHQGAL